jgi:hypothetical protein
MKWILVILYLYIAYTDFRYAKGVWKRGNKLAGGFIVLTACVLIILPFIAFFK